MNKIDNVFRTLRESKETDVREWIKKYREKSEIARYSDYLEDEDFLDMTDIYNYLNDLADDIPKLYMRSSENYSLPNMKSFDSLSEAEESVYDEKRAGDTEAFTYANMYYPFSYLPMPEFMDTKCNVDTVSNKLVLGHKRSEVDMSIKTLSTAGIDHSSKRDAVHTFSVFDGTHDLVVSARGNYEFNCIEFDIVTSKGCWAEVVSAFSEDTDYLTKEIRIDHAKRVRLYFDPVKSIDITIRLYSSNVKKELYANILNVKAFVNTYTAGSLEIDTSLSGSTYFQIGYRMSEYSSIACSVISDGKYFGKFYPVSGETYLFNLSKTKFIVNLSTQNNRSTPMLTYIRFGAKSVISNVF